MGEADAQLESGTKPIISVVWRAAQIRSVALDEKQAFFLKSLFKSEGF